MRRLSALPLGQQRREVGHHRLDRLADVCDDVLDIGERLIHGVGDGRKYLRRGLDETIGDRKVGCVGMVAMLPDMMLVATGMAMAF